MSFRINKSNNLYSRLSSRDVPCSFVYDFFFRKFASGDHLEVLLSAAVGRLVVTLDTAAANQDAVRPIEVLSAYTMDLQSVMCFGLEV